MTEQVEAYRPRRGDSGYRQKEPSTQKNMLPTPPGSPEDLRTWSPALDNVHSEVSPLPRLGSSRLASGPLMDIKHMRIGKMSDYSFGQSPNSLRMLSSYPEIQNLTTSEIETDNPIIARALASGAPKRYRGEKKPIPDTQKDGKYFERRQRNNMAAKKSRDARKYREDQIAMRANLLEKENAILRAQVSTLRDEANSLRNMLIQKRSNRAL